MWDLAKSDAKDLPEDDALLVFGTTIYDMLALEASSHPVVYLRQIGTHAGLLYPPTNLHVNKRFVVSQDMLEMIMRSCVEPDETLVATELKERLWNRFGIVIDGDEADMEKSKQPEALSLQIQMLFVIILIVSPRRLKPLTLLTLWLMAYYKLDWEVFLNEN